MAGTTNRTDSRTTESLVTENVTQKAKQTAEELKEYGERIKSRMSELPEYGRDILTRIDESAHANPWLHVGIACVGGFLVGMAFGRLFSTDRSRENGGIPERTFLRAEEEFGYDS